MSRGIQRERDFELLKHDMEFACQQRDEARLMAAQWKTIANERYDRVRRLEEMIVLVNNYAIEFLNASDQLRIAELTVG